MNCGPLLPVLAGRGGERRAAGEASAPSPRSSRGEGRDEGRLLALCTLQQGRSKPPPLTGRVALASQWSAAHLLLRLRSGDARPSASVHGPSPGWRLLLLTMNISEVFRARKQVCGRSARIAPPLPGPASQRTWSSDLGLRYGVRLIQPAEGSSPKIPKRRHVPISL